MQEHQHINTSPGYVSPAPMSLSSLLPADTPNNSSFTTPHSLQSALLSEIFYHLEESQLPQASKVLCATWLVAPSVSPENCKPASFCGFASLEPVSVLD
jgi:hypothetical protein